MEAGRGVPGARVDEEVALGLDTQHLMGPPKQVYRTVEGKASLLQNTSTAPLGRNNDAKRPEITNIHTHCACLAGISGLECACVLTAMWVSLLGEEKWPGPLFLAGQQGCDADLTWVELNGLKLRTIDFKKKQRKYTVVFIKVCTVDKLHQNHLEVLFKNTHSFILSLNKQIVISCVWQA